MTPATPCSIQNTTPTPVAMSGGALRGQRGFAAIAGIFLIVVLAALGAYMVSFSNSMQLSSAQDLQGSRAYWAARAGLEWGIANTANCATFAPASPTTLTGATVGGVFTAFDGGITVNVDCSSQAYTEAGTGFTIYKLNATAKTSASVGSLGYVERNVSVTVEK